MDAKGTIRVLGGGSEASQRQEQRAETLPVAFASGAGNHAVERRENTVDGLHVVPARCGSARRRTGRGLWGRLLLSRRLCGGRLRRSGKRKAEKGRQGQKSASHWDPPLRQLCSRSLISPCQKAGALRLQCGRETIYQGVPRTTLKLKKSAESGNATG